ncbi:MAG: FAD-dependent oxidoreductase [Thermoguttaceae bacterium]|nr:FAD-dependent oxidoreductase [Thermoguttaceae bacterium]
MMPTRRVLIVGGVAGGASCAARLRRMDEYAEIFMFERSGHVSFANCGLPYFLGGVIAERGKLLVATPERFRDILNIEVRTRHEVTAIHREAKTIEVTQVETGQISVEPYDTLVLAPGATPIRPALPGIDMPGIFTLRNLEDMDAIHHWISRQEAERAVVVGGGYIGLEVTENLSQSGLEVTLLEAFGQLMAPFDPEMVTPLNKCLRDHGVELYLNKPAARFEPGPGDTLNVLTHGSERFSADLVVVAAGVRPDVELARAAGIELGVTGGIRVDDQMRTSDPDIFAVGDAVEVRDFVTGQPALIPLAGPASRQGRVAADVIAGRDSRFRGTQGTAVVGAFDLTLAMTGASEKALRCCGIPYRKSYNHAAHHAGYYPGAEEIALKLLYAPEDGRLLGAQAVGKEGVDKRIDVIALAIQKGGTVFELEEAELCYAPQYGSAKDPVNLAGFVAGNALRGDVKTVFWEDWLARQQGGESVPLVLDVRPLSAEAVPSVPGALNIPLGELRSRLGELPRDREIWVHCAIGQSSYYATRVLTQHGFQNVYNLSGGITSLNMLPGR